MLAGLGRRHAGRELPSRPRRREPSTPRASSIAALTENVALGLYGYNATLAAVALFLWRRSLIPPLLGILLSVPLTELVPMLGLPALTAPFVLATWLVLAFGWLEGSSSESRRRRRLMTPARRGRRRSLRLDALDLPVESCP